MDYELPRSVFDHFSIHSHAHLVLSLKNLHYTSLAFLMMFSSLGNLLCFSCILIFSPAANVLNLFFLIQESNFLVILSTISPLEKCLFLAVIALIIYSFKYIAY